MNELEYLIKPIQKHVANLCLFRIGKVPGIDIVFDVFPHLNLLFHSRLMLFLLLYFLVHVCHISQASAPQDARLPMTSRTI